MKHLSIITICLAVTATGGYVLGLPWQLPVGVVTLLSAFIAGVTAVDYYVSRP